MTAWDRLWEEIDWDRVTTIPFITERIKEIRAEGDRLQKEGLEHHAIAVAYYEKLEAIKTWFASNNTKTRVSMKSWKELKEILEGDDDV